MADVIEVALVQYGLVQELLAAAWFDMPQIEAALEGRQQARMFVDRLPAPRAVMLCHPYDYYVAGDPEASGLRQFIAEAPAEAGVFATLYGFCPVGDAWEHTLLADYAGRLERIGRRQFQYGATSAPPAALPIGYRIAAIDAGLAQRIDMELHEHLVAVWGDYDSFAAARLGCCLLAGETIAAVAYPAAVSSRWADVTVATAESFRRRGLARAVCSAYVGQCLARGLTVVWDTDDVNLASASLALGLGFVEKRPFCELGTPGRHPLALSHGHWSLEPISTHGPRRWRRRERGPE